MRDGPEQRVKRQISEFLSFKGAFFWWNHSTGLFDPRTKSYRKRNGTFDMNGTSDILGIYKGRPLAVEVKATTKPSQAQILFLTRFIEQGGIGIVAYSIEDVADLLEAGPEMLLNALIGPRKAHNKPMRITS